MAPFQSIGLRQGLLAFGSPRKSAPRHAKIIALLTVCAIVNVN
jgi:hypothetical protein